MKAASFKPILRSSLLVIIGVGLGFGAAHFAYRRERAHLMKGYYFQSSERPELAWLKSADPLTDFRSAAAKGQVEFIGVQGGMGAPFVPGVDHTQHADAIKNQGVHFLPTSASCFPNEINPDLDRAIAYARSYNTLVLHQLDK